MNKKCLNGFNVSISSSSSDGPGMDVYKQIETIVRDSLLPQNYEMVYSKYCYCITVNLRYICNDKRIANGVHLSYNAKQ